MKTQSYPLMRKSLTDSWRSTVGWGIGLLAIMSLYLPLYPSIGGSPQMRELLASLPQEMIRALNYDQIASGPGYTQATFFGLTGFLLMSIAAISWGASAIGGDEEAGLLELTIAHGVTRTQVVLERTAALVIRILLLALLVLVVILALNGPAQLGIDPAKVVAGVLMFVLLTLLGGTGALVAGALSGRRMFGIIAGTAIAVVGYVFNALGNQSQDLQWLHNFSPYYWAYGQSPLVSGVPWASVAGLGALSLLFIVVSVLALRHRDIGAS
ncbi:ABC transporter permease subunit [Paeniglutamicibacter kerguelensis]|uniref:ABC-2 type transport system permease protein n=1 Tax=Paeniglutamicibacter kerguelensis TaxID=254788 RepID=A0ABS4XGK4_9MICC|nr:ABC transporter permease subunit [Paeniglutamicibacter kerguelensis]MBP2387604.1 ABC-2 type transport system permease protein [Paeniglutamicibacter kerguelensis]